MHHKSQHGVLRLSARGGDHLSLWPRSVCHGQYHSQVSLCNHVPGSQARTKTWPEHLSLSKATYVQSSVTLTLTIQKRSTAVDGHKCAISVAHGASCLESDSDIGDIRNIAQLQTDRQSFANPSISQSLVSFELRLPTTPKSFDSTLDQAMELTLKPKRRQNPSIQL
jgi:hypothetical protein